MSLTKGTISGVVGGLVLGFSGAVLATGWGISPHYAVNKKCLTIVEHLVDPHSVGKLLHEILPSGHNIVGGSGDVVLVWPGDLDRAAGGADEDRRLCGQGKGEGDNTATGEKQRQETRRLHDQAPEWRVAGGVGKHDILLAKRLA